MRSSPKLLDVIGDGTRLLESPKTLSSHFSGIARFEFEADGSLKVQKCLRLARVRATAGGVAPPQESLVAKKTDGES